MPFYINRRNVDVVETIEETNNSREAHKRAFYLCLSDPTSRYYVARQACKAYKEAKSNSNSSTGSDKGNPG